ncbi:uncharacterized protein Z519_08652 [Cladophialophora bantiana CBS 173.52]|uniref:Cation/H+ exchanger transmembrane domain-containing protein n=1 Tax=Cladophialophora bantiana (strain ATCC 10958 / CBS 173.52 / CDC B-1940 / NIH 8579) TaxID=1442370 RepID=A0A0D2I1V2_CLAB1|nr:uncharacterized protein Z519_08652 [Cladophialophora bantiana CBS 173.52]KIW90869.1 hypothetical protein Z519_08652 [Cladophialophora bantiana CBS 173.52]
MADAALPYHEPGIITILIQSSFLLILNILGFALDHISYCGLVGQVLIGMAYGTPGLKLLPHAFEEVATQLGYLGLIAIVFEGGLATSAKSLGNSLILSICVALTGICLPMALSFALMGISNATRLQAFAAGAALCSTSLGTTFSLLKTTSLTMSRLGTVLSSAAMLDDVVGLIMVQVITNLGSGQTSISAATVIRPIFVSLGFAIVLPVVCQFLVKPMLPYCSVASGKLKGKYPAKTLGLEVKVPFLFRTAFLVALITAASYAGTSNLFAAYLAGAAISWLDEISRRRIDTGFQRASQETPKDQMDPAKATPGTSSVNFAAARNASEIPGSSVEKLQSNKPQASKPSLELTPPPEDSKVTSAVERNAGSADIPDPLKVESRSLQMYNHYYAPAVERILKPFFFASIGFSIPITKMFRGPVIWRGLVYATFMAVGKLFCGMWLIRFFNPSSTTSLSPRPRPATESDKQDKNTKQAKSKTALRERFLPRPKSLYPASILGCAMVARGEIGFLISALAATNGIFASKSEAGNAAAAAGDAAGLVSDLYLIVTWAILLCTIVGPLALGFLAKRVKRLQDERARDGGHGTKEDPLGIWGVN